MSRDDVITLTYHGPDFSDIPCPYNGINFWLLKVARRCAKAALAREAAERQMYELAEGARRLLTDKEVKRALDKVYNEDPSSVPATKQPVVVVNQDLIASMTKDGRVCMILMNCRHTNVPMTRHVLRRYCRSCLNRMP